jgi:hypothetical protein
LFDWLDSPTKKVTIREGKTVRATHKNVPLGRGVLATS